MLHDILVVDDESDIREQIKGILGDEGLEARTAANSEDALKCIHERLPSLIILDIWLQNSKMDGLELLSAIKKESPQIPIIMISGHGTIETAISALKKGAVDFIEKPFKTDRLLLVINRTLEAEKLRKENAELRLRSSSDEEMVGQSPAMQQLRQSIERVAPTNSRVMITGEAGSGKEIVARAIHAKSKRAQSPFVVVNCALMTPDKLEVELFGTEPGYISGQPRKVGVFEIAHKGTLLLDEVADMPLETQGKILRILQEQKFTRVGGNTPVQVDVRVMAASNKDLAREITAGRLRQDLFYRLSVVPIAVPSLKERREDISKLASYFINKASKAAGVPARLLSQDAVAALQSYPWPGNVRQLKNAMEWLLIMASGSPKDLVTTEMLPPELYGSAPPLLKTERNDEIMTLPLRDARELFEKQYLLAQVTRFGGNISKTATFVGMERSALHRKLKSFGVYQPEKSEREAA